MQKLYTPARMVVIFIIMALILTVYVSALYNVQVYQPRLHADEQSHGRIITRTSTIAAARGNIYDRNGVLLASGRPSYDIRLDWWALRGMPEANDVVLELINATLDEGLTYNDTFPVTRGAPFEYLTNMTSTQRNRLNTYFEYHGINPEIDVSELLAWFHNHYRIHYTIGILDARLIIGVRYELEIRAIIGSITPYVFSADISTDFVSYLAERNLTGVFIETSYAREYHTVHAPHLLGYIGRMTAEEYEVYKERGYPMDALVGKIGTEFAFEEILHGSEGQRIVQLNEEGTVFRDEVTKEPEPGQHIYLTLDLDLQIASEHALRSQIETINHQRQEANATRDDDDEELELITGGAVVVTNVNTGEILAAASYPTFNLLTLSQDWPMLNTDPNFPMFNRATQATYAPGSTFKMVTALAGLRNISFLSRYFPIDDTGRFTKYEDVGFVATCWLYNSQGVGHREVNLVQALACSCNYYFLQVSDWLAGGHAANAADMLAEAAMEFGLGIKTGLEIPEAAGRLALPEVKALLKPTEGWYNADVLLAGFGQGENRFTPVQLANYAATIGNGGTLYSLSFLRRVVSADFTEPIFENEPRILNQIEETDFISYIQEGMVAVSTGPGGTGRPVFLNYPITVAAKTGTVQIEGRSMNNGIFVCYAPANNPEIAISVVVEKGGSGSQIMAIARMIFDHYFITESTFLAVPYGQMIP
ncbi:MAG: penicillin-binding transpeptidase domain-containing protein [Oscillospiraceae bacterium]|nr:penicillin-binding transpeptidase domain-containing protein [Oscillospiraceae bacterium]